MHAVQQTQNPTSQEPKVIPASSLPALAPYKEGVTVVSFTFTALLSSASATATALLTPDPVLVHPSSKPVTVQPTNEIHLLAVKIAQQKKKTHLWCAQS